MSNKIIDEQRRAREEFIKLKRMQQGEIEPEDDSAAVIIPLTFKEKLQNYWYHFKWHTITVIALAIVLAITITQCATREKYDFITVLFTYSAVTDDRIDEIEKYLEQFGKDIDGDGKVNIQIVNCSVPSNNNNSQLNQTSIAKLQSMVAAEPNAMLYIVDKKGYNYLESLNENGFFDAEPILLPDEFYEQCNGEEKYEKLPKELKIGYRRIGGTTMQKDKTAKKVHKLCEEILKEITK